MAASGRYPEGERPPARPPATKSLRAGRYRSQYTIRANLRTLCRYAMLTGREYEVLQLVAHGLRTHAIATHLGIAEATVVAFIRSARVKLGARNRVQAAHLAAGGTLPAVPREALEPEQLKLLDLLAAGSTVDEAATSLYLSRRTVQRRLAEIRNVLGVSTTAAAVASSARFRDAETQVAGGAPDEVGVHSEEPER